MTAPVKWFASPCDAPNATGYDRVAVGAKAAIELLGDAETIRVQRSTGADAGTLPQLRIFIQDAAVLLADAEHGDALHALARLLTRHGLPAGIRLEMQW